METNFCILRGYHLVRLVNQNNESYIFCMITAFKWRLISYESNYKGILVQSVSKEYVRLRNPIFLSSRIKPSL